MKVFIALVCLFASALSAAPRPTGVYFVVAPKPAEPADLAKVTEEVMARLKSQEGSDSGEYHVYLPDGRLQKVQYTTAPLKEEEEPAKPLFLVAQQNKQQAFKVEPVYFPPQSAPSSARQTAEEEKPASNYVASVQYTDVQPITGPVYSYNPEPLVRIVRYAPRFH